MHMFRALTNKMHVADMLRNSLFCPLTLTVIQSGHHVLDSQGLCSTISVPSINMTKQATNVRVTNSLTTAQ